MYISTDSRKIINAEVIENTRKISVPIIAGTTLRLKVTYRLSFDMKIAFLSRRADLKALCFFMVLKAYSPNVR